MVKGAHQPGKREGKMPWNNNDVDELFFWWLRGRCAITCFIHRRRCLSAAENPKTRYSSDVCQKAEQFHTFQCMRDLKSIAHKLHTWPRYFTLNPRYTYCFARRGFSRNKTDSFALPEKKYFPMFSAF